MRARFDAMGCREMTGQSRIGAGALTGSRRSDCAFSGAAVVQAVKGQAGNSSVACTVRSSNRNVERGGL